MWENRLKIIIAIFIVTFGTFCIWSPNTAFASDSQELGGIGDAIVMGSIVFSTVPCVIVSLVNANQIEGDGSYFWGSTGVLLGVPVTIGGIYLLSTLDEDEDPLTEDHGKCLLGIPVSIVGTITTIAGIKSFHRALNYDRNTEKGLVVDPIIFPDNQGRVGFGLQISKSF
ncbi:MAG TPA: hypothetical protein VKO43_01490 [Candidatus Krumholzibacteriaceae bacterium]|nr:hypothetical protein [Candidatus Krumholzibacteriaceae bacterium]